MDTVLIDIDSNQVVLGKLDGHSLTLKAVSATDLNSACNKWLCTYSSSNPFQLLFRYHKRDGNDTDQQKILLSLASSHGIRGVRSIGNHISTDPGIAAARYYADRDRLGDILSVEVTSTHATLAVTTPRQGVIAHHRFLPLFDHTIAAVLLTELAKTLLASARLPRGDDDPPALVAFGERGPAFAEELAQACQLTNILIPEHAPFLATIGMLFADIVLEFREDLPLVQFDRALLRPVFGRLMDQAGAAITLEGYDLDDAICRRQVTLTRNGQLQTIELDDEEWDESGVVIVRSAAVVAIITIRKPDLPPSAIRIV